LLMTTAIASSRCAGFAEILQDRLDRLSRHLAAPIVAVVSIAMMAWTVAFPPQMLLHGFAEFMGQFDAVAIPALFEQPKTIRTIALQNYPLVFWGVGDAWCRGSMDVFGAQRSDLLDKAFGNLTCMVDRENPSIDLSTYNRVVFPGLLTTSLEGTIATMAQHFPNVAARFVNCHTITANIPTYNLNECELRLSQ
jgi:hypothetical protein